MAATLSITPLRAVAGALVVDGGRPGHRHRGIVSGGPADRTAAAAANRLLGQAATTPCLETTLRGGAWLLSGRGQVALTGAEVAWTLDGLPVDRYRVLDVGDEQVLAGGIVSQGCRAYIGVRGEWGLPRVYGSVEVGLRGTFALTTGQSFSITAEHPTEWKSESAPAPLGRPLIVTAFAGPEWRWLSARQRAWLGQKVFTVSPQSNRQGIRLLSESEIEVDLPSMLSSAVLPGTVQWSPAGLILLGPDAQTVGGYPRVLQVELDGVMQLRAGEGVRFRWD